MKKRARRPLNDEEWNHMVAMQEKLCADMKLGELLVREDYTKQREYIYLTKADFGYKIGRTTRPEKRPLTVAGNCPIKLEVIVVIEVADMRKAEAELHSRFASKRLRGEWFDLSPEDVELIKGYPGSLINLPKSDIDEEDVPF